MKLTPKMKKILIIVIIGIVIIGGGTLLYLQLNKTAGNNDNKPGDTNNGGASDDDDDTNNGGTSDDDDDTNNGGTSDDDDTNNGGTSDDDDTNNGGTSDDDDDTTNNPGTGTSTTVKSGSLCKNEDYIKLNTTLIYCVEADGSINVRSETVNITTDTATINAAIPILSTTGVNILFTEKIKNIAYFYPGNGETIGFLGLSIMTTESGTAYLVDNTTLYEKGQISVYATVNIDEKVISFTSPDKSVACVGADTCGLSTTIKTSSGKVYIVNESGYYKAK